MEITKSTVEVYKIRNAKNSAWADITIDGHEKSGRLSISSDYGDWAYYWSHCGSSFKDFLCNLDIGYVSGKFGTDRYFNFDATIKSWKRQVIDERRAEYLKPSEARELFDEIKEIEEESPGKEGLMHMVWNSTHLSSFSDPHIETRIKPTFKIFWNEIWIPFTEELKKESLELA